MKEGDFQEWTDLPEHSLNKQYRYKVRFGLIRAHPLLQVADLVLLWGSTVYCGGRWQLKDGVSKQTVTLGLLLLNSGAHYTSKTLAALSLSPSPSPPPLSLSRTHAHVPLLFLLPLATVALGSW